MAALIGRTLSLSIFTKFRKMAFQGVRYEPTLPRYSQGRDKVPKASAHQGSRSEVPKTVR